MSGRILKSWAAMLLMLVCLFSCALADTVVKDGIEVTLTTDKQDYQAGEQIHIAFYVTNHSDRVIEPVSVTYDIPDTCLQVSAEDVMRNVLEGQETGAFGAVLQVTSAPQGELPQTGDDSSLLLWLALACAGVLGAARMKAHARRRLFAGLAAAVLAGTMLLQAEAAKAQDKKAAAGDTLMEITVSETVSIMGLQEQITATLVFRDMTASAGDEYINMIGKPLEQTMTQETKIVYDAVLDSADAVMPESSHPYAVSSDEVYIIRGGEGTTQISLYFGEQCEVENRYDALLIYDANGEYVTHYTGIDMRGEEIVTQGECAYVRLVADRTVTKYGFDFEAIVPHRPSVLEAIYLNSSNKPVIQWKQIQGYKGFVIERAEISDSGSIGAFKRIANKTSGTANSYTDKKASLNKAYAYRVCQYVTTDKKRYASPFSESENIFLLASPVLKSGKESVLNGKPQIALQWNAVKNAEQYRIFRSAQEDGIYECIAATDGITYVDVLEERAQYYYKITACKEYAGTVYESAYSKAKNFGFMVAPNALTAESTSTKKVRLSWPKVQRASGYGIFRSEKKDGTYELVTRTSSTSKVVSAVAPGTVSYFMVRSYGKSGKEYVYSDDSSPIAAVFPLEAPDKPDAISNGETGDVILTWEAVANADSYEVYFSSAKKGPYALCAKTDMPQAVVSGLADSLTTVYFKVLACRTDDGVISRSELSDPVKHKRNLTVVRNLYIYEQYAPQGAAMVTYEPDRALLDGMFAKASPFGRGVSLVNAYTDQSKSKVKSRISAMAKLADSNDVTVFVLSCHGDDSIKYGEKAGELCMSDGKNMTFTELAKALKKIPGRVVIMLTSCGSGSSIDKVAAAGSETGMTDSQAFLADFIDAIKQEDELIVLSEGAPVDFGDQLMPANGELLVAGKFYVIATTLGGESGWYNNRDGSMLMRWMSPGVMGADANGDRTVTLDEMSDYLTWKGDNTLINGKERMYPQVYPDNSNFPLFKAH